MAKRRRPKRHHLLLYRQILRRHRFPAFLLGILLFLLGILTWFQWVDWPRPPWHLWFIGASMISLSYWFFTLLAPSFAYIQPRPDRIRIQIPFYRLNISYRRIRNTRPVDIAKAFSPNATPRTYRRAIRAFYGDTALGLDLTSWPLPRWLLGFLLGKLMLAPDQPGLIIITADWIGLSKEIETLLGTWSDEQRQRLHRPGAYVQDILESESNKRR